MAIVDMYNIVHDMTLLNKPMLNVYQVERANSGETAGAVSDAFQNDILPAIRLFQTNDVVNNELRIFNMGDPLDFGSFTLSASLGFRTGLVSPRFVSAGIRFPSTNRDVRSGFKRFAGAEESDYTDGVIIGATITLLNNIADAMLANWTASADSHTVCNFVIVKRVCKTLEPVTEKCLQYRLPETDGELVFYTPTSRITQSDITSQVSRKL